MEYREYRSYDALGLAELVAAKQVQSSELLEVALQRYRQVDPALNAVSLLLEDVGRAAAQQAGAGRFAGVPFLIKDLMQDYAGYPTSGGTGPLRRVIAERHSIVVARWLEAGLVIFGKTTTPEFGTKGITETPTFGATRNPWDLDRTPGGSSGGAAAAVAAGIVPMAGASDGGGSIRIPAACTGLFGLKPGRGLVPCGPNSAEYIFGAATEGVLSRSVRDSAAMLDILTEPDFGAPYHGARFERGYAEAVTAPPGRLRIGFAQESPLGTPVDPEAVRAVEDAAALLESLGHDVVAAAPAYDGQALAQDFLTVWTAHIGWLLRDACARSGAKTTEFDVDTQILGAVGRALPAPTLIEAQQRWNTYTRALAAFHADYDFLLTPAIAAPALRIGQNETPAALKHLMPPLLRLGLGKLLPRIGFYHDLVNASLAAIPFTQLANVTGRPAMSVPLYRTETDLPLGVQFVGAPGSEFGLLQLAAQLEQARPWAHLEPPEPTAR